MEVKKYRVVCSQPKFSDEIYIDIAPDSGIIHDQIFFSRIQLHKQIDNQPLSRLYGSIYLQDCNGNISVEFPKPQARKDTPDYEGIMKRYAELEPKIIERYEAMKKFGEESTLFVYGIDRMFEMSEDKIAEGDAFEKKRRAKMKEVEVKTYKQKHAEQLLPHNSQEERMLREKENFLAVRERRIEGEKKRAHETTPAWLRFQSQYSGD
ncbi:MAG: hypothetical protein IJ532_04050 [Alphaproteobacteria bacterium]|nr:hypothetical protein [Alphaproteobacteria bacterium]